MEIIQITNEEKIEIINALDELGFNVIELGHDYESLQIQKNFTKLIIEKINDKDE